MRDPVQSELRPRELLIRPAARHDGERRGIGRARLRIGQIRMVSARALLASDHTTSVMTRPRTIRMTRWCPDPRRRETHEHAFHFCQIKPAFSALLTASDFEWTCSLS